MDKLNKMKTFYVYGGELIKYEASLNKEYLNISNIMRNPMTKFYLTDVERPALYIDDSHYLKNYFNYPINFKGLIK